MWKVLGGEFYGHVTLNNLRMLLLAIKGLHIQIQNFDSSQADHGLFRLADAYFQI